MGDADRAAWEQVARGVTPLAGKAPGKPAPRVSSAPAAGEKPATGPDGPGKGRAERPAPPVPDSPPAAVRAPFRVGSAAALRGRPPVLSPGPAERLAAAALRMDAGTHRNLVRGKLRPEARIDLHGMTLAIAKAELTGFILSAQASGRRLVLVITGKGKGDHGPLPTRSGALRHEVPHWLQMAPVAAAVMQVVPAHFRHGGAGAYYVYLRRTGRERSPH